MKKGFGFYTAAWALALALFNLLAFVPGIAYGTNGSGAFWTGYAGITVAFVGQLVCACFALKTGNAQKTFYRLPLVAVSYTGLVLTLICGGTCMLIPGLPAWIGALVCLFVMLLNAIALVKAAAAAELVAGADEKVRTQTQFIKNLTVDAENLCAHAATDEAKAACKKVYEAIRYSDPMSAPGLSDIETKIAAQMQALAAAVASGTDMDKAADALVLLVKERNGKCKVLK